MLALFASAQVLTKLGGFGIIAGGKPFLEGTFQTGEQTIKSKAGVWGVLCLVSLLLPAAGCGLVSDDSECNEGEERCIDKS